MRANSLLFLALCWPFSVFAGAWPLPEGQLQVINTVSAYSSDTRYDNFGNPLAQPTYNKHEYNPYIEYGLTDDITVGANLFLQRASQNGSVNYGIADSEFFLKKQIWKSGGYVASIQPIVKLPRLWEQDNTPMIGSSHMDVGVSALGGYGFEMYDLSHYVEVETGYRYRFGDPENRFLLNATAGVGVTGSITIMPQVFTAWRATNPSGAPTFTQTTQDDYDLVKLQLSGLYRASDTVAYQAGVFGDVYGRNAGKGQGALFSVWLNF